MQNECLSNKKNKNLTVIQSYDALKFRKKIFIFNLKKLCLDLHIQSI